ncbi:MAG: hypothetical protein ACE10D_00045 [Planctomycetota bacterium]|nr:hypothetical protein [Planctomycetota bacterium]
MQRLRFLLLLPALTVACAESTPIGDVPLRISAAVQEVPLGKAFALTVVRVWDKGAAADWNDEALAPLHVRLVETSRRADGNRVEETRRYSAYAFTLGDVTEPVELRVKRALDPTAPGPAELPAAPASGSIPWAAWLAATLGAFALFLYVKGLRRPRAEPQAQELPAAVTPEPHLRALERIERLRPLQPESHEDLQAYYQEASGLVRDYVRERFALMTAVLTTEELLQRSTHRDMLANVLRHCDLVKFARHAATAPEREHMLDGADTFIRETRA